MASHFCVWHHIFGRFYIYRLKTLTVLWILSTSVFEIAERLPAPFIFSTELNSWNSFVPLRLSNNFGPVEHDSSIERSISILHFWRWHITMSWKMLLFLYNISQRTCGLQPIYIVWCLANCELRAIYKISAI